ncbi:MAG: hypothetical protein ABSH25_12115, partial [Syntrophorhabdales bacterium]
MVNPEPINEQVIMMQTNSARAGPLDRAEQNRSTFSFISVPLICLFGARGNHAQKRFPFKTKMIESIYVDYEAIRVAMS